MAGRAARAPGVSGAAVRAPQPKFKAALDPAPPGRSRLGSRKRSPVREATVRPMDGLAANTHPLGGSERGASVLHINAVNRLQTGQARAALQILAVPPGTPAVCALP